jgi:hypothetical protein
MKAIFVMPFYISIAVTHARIKLNYKKHFGRNPNEE